jgi:hypothetical protein
MPGARSSVGKYPRGRSPYYHEMGPALLVAAKGRACCAAMINRRSAGRELEVGRMPDR